MSPNIRSAAVSSVPAVQGCAALLCVMILMYYAVMSWGWTEGIPRFYILGEDLASAYVLRHQMSTVLEFWARGRRGLGGLCMGTGFLVKNSCIMPYEKTYAIKIAIY